MEIRGIQGCLDRFHVLHTYFRVADGSLLAFFERRSVPFRVPAHDDAALHIAFDVDAYARCLRCERAPRRPASQRREIGDHGCLYALHVRDPNGYIVELAPSASNQ